jgi:hypothetical protein
LWRSNASYAAKTDLLAPAITVTSQGGDLIAAESGNLASVMVNDAKRAGQLGMNHSADAVAFDQANLDLV